MKKPKARRRATTKRTGHSLAELMRATGSGTYGADPVVPIRTQEPPPLRNRKPSRG